jgi:hypothetical protein
MDGYGTYLYESRIGTGYVYSDKFIDDDCFKRISKISW